MFKRLIAATSLSLAFAVPAAAQDYPQMTLRMAHPLPETWPAVEWDKWWAEEVERRSDGNIEIKIFWSGQIGGLKEIKTLLGNGAVPLGVFAQAVHASDMPLSSIGGGLLNQVSEDPATAQRLAGETYAADATQEELEELNLVPIKWTVPTEYRFQCTEPVRTVDDLDGMRIRAVGGAFVPIWMESLGITPTRVQAPEIREGLQRGTLDCNFGPVEWSTFFDLHEVAPYLSDINTGSFTTFQLYAARDTFNGWPESVQKLMREVGQEAMERELDAIDDVRQENLERFREAGGEVVELQDPERLMEMTPDMVDVWIKHVEEQGERDKIEPLIPMQRRAADEFDSPTL